MAFNVPEVGVLQTQDDAIEDLEKVFNTTRDVYYEILGGQLDYTPVPAPDNTQEDWDAYTGAMLAYRLKANDTTMLGVIFGTEGPKSYMTKEGAKLTQWARYTFVNEDGTPSEY